MTSEQPLAIREDQLAAPQPLSLEVVLQGVVAGGITPETVGTVREIMQLMQAQRELDAKQAFAEAFAAMQSDMKRVVATRLVLNKDDTLRYKFAPFEDLMAQCQPILSEHGFGVSFNSRIDGDRFVAICTLEHKRGHSRVNESAMRISGPPGATITQADGATQTYAKRYALIDALNIVVSKLDNDGADDAGNIGAFITASQAADMRERVIACGANEKLFLKFAGATTYEGIAIKDLDRLDVELTKKERAAK